MLKGSVFRLSDPILSAYSEFEFVAKGYSLVIRPGISTPLTQKLTIGNSRGKKRICPYA